MESCDAAAMPSMGAHATGELIVSTGLIGVIFAAYLMCQISKVKLDVSTEDVWLLEKGEKKDAAWDTNDREEKDSEAGPIGPLSSNQRLNELYEAIKLGANSFLSAEYRMCTIFVLISAPLIAILISNGSTFQNGFFSAAAFTVGAFTSMLSGWIGMRVAVYSNARCTVGACQPSARGWTESFNTAFRAGGVMGFSLCGLALLCLYVLINVFSMWYDPDVKGSCVELMDCIAGFGLGGSAIAMFGRVGGGIYTKAADVGVDLAGKVVEDLPEDDPHNPGTIADNVGDNVGDVAGMGSDLFGSFGEATCAALLVGASSDAIVTAGWGALMFPLSISGVGIVVCLLTSFVATHLKPVRREADIESALKLQLFVSTALMTPAVYFLSKAVLPSSFLVSAHCSTPWYSFLCVGFGLWGGCAIGFITEYYTSFSYRPVQEVSDSCRTGAATNIIYGLALGYKSVIFPVIILAAIVYGAHMLAGMYGISLSALGMLATLATCLTIDVYGPVCDNAGGIAEMCELHPDVRQKTDALDAAGNTTAAIGKGFAIGSASLVGLALFGAFVTRLNASTGKQATVDLLDPLTFSGLLLGSMLPYWFSAMTMKSVGMAANAMVIEIKRQFDLNPNLLIPNHPDRPDYEKCIRISTDASLKEMVAPGALVMLSPILVGVFLGTKCVTGLLAGAIASGVQMAISASNTGGAWDNAKKYIGKGELDDLIAKLEPDCVQNGVVQTKKSQIYKAAVTGDTVGDPLKDTSGPALNILMKLMAIISVVFADFFLSINGGGGIISFYV
ncbi:hypothetical protein AB1Y20_008172 [Prymnesium parvum]|uniref:H(+)-exporting diphosphatase n=1 Tax=Prymnesium parvum TaxID=97485 RepID=A0AB34ITG5_PRYPA